MHVTLHFLFMETSVTINDLISIMCSWEYKSLLRQEWSLTVPLYASVRAVSRALFDLGAHCTSCLLWSDYGNSAAAAGRPAWPRTSRPANPKSPQTPQSPAAAGWWLHTRRWSRSRRGGSPQRRSTSRSNASSGLWSGDRNADKHLLVIDGFWTLVKNERNGDESRTEKMKDSEKESETESRDDETEINVSACVAAEG